MIYINHMIYGINHMIHTPIFVTLSKQLYDLVQNHEKQPPKQKAVHTTVIRQTQKLQTQNQPQIQSRQPIQLNQTVIVNNKNRTDENKPGQKKIYSGAISKDNQVGFTLQSVCDHRTRPLNAIFLEYDLSIRSF